MVALKSTRVETALLALSLGLALSACDKPHEKIEEIRPVRVMQLSSSSVDVDAEFAGEVRARIESRLGFRVGGKIVARKVDVGALVHKGQLLMQLDPQDLQLAQAQALAGLRAAETNRDLARSELKRYQDLRDKNFVSQTVLENKESAFKSAQSSVDANQAGYHGQANQAGYAKLVADIDGVVTAVDAEVGQVVAPGTPVVRVAKNGQKEVVIGLPEDKVDTLRNVEDVRVRLWAHPNDVIAGTIREVSPVADPATRTYTVKVSIPDTLTDARLGMTANVQFASQTATPQITVPLSALFYEKQATSVWVVEKGVVRLVPVTVETASGNDAILSSGVHAGQTVVTAGVNLLKPGQKVKILGNDPAAAPTPAPVPGAAGAVK